MSEQSEPPQNFFAEPPIPEDTKKWSQAFLEAQSPNPNVRQRGRDKLTEMGYAWTETQHDEPS